MMWEHFDHLRDVFQTLDRTNFSIKPVKASVGYLSILLFGHRVDGLGMITAKDNLAAITALEFPKMLHALHKGLGMRVLMPLHRLLRADPRIITA